MWGHFLVDSKNYTIFSIAPNQEEAKKIALEKVTDPTRKQYLKNHLSTTVPTIIDEPYSFIFQVETQFSF